MEIGEYFITRLLMGSTNFFKQKKRLIFSVVQSMGRTAVKGGVRVRV